MACCKEGDRYKCPDASCGCEIQVTKEPAAGGGGDAAPTCCCCGMEMNKV